MNAARTVTFGFRHLSYFDCLLQARGIVFWDGGERQWLNDRYWGDSGPAKTPSACPLTLSSGAYAKQVQN